MSKSNWILRGTTKWKEQKKKAIERLQRAHDDLKKCAFRITMSVSDMPEYITQLYELSDAWSNLGYRVSMPAEEQKLFRSFCWWIHDYNSVLLHMGFKKTDVKYMQYWVPYFEAMLNVTHAFLDTGNMNVFYNPRIFSHPEGYQGSALGEKWCLVTSEMCGIDSPYLPCYLPTTLPLCADADEMKKYFLKEKYYGFRVEVNEEQRLNYYYKWENEVKPILVWVNNNLVPKSNRDSGYTSNVWRADLKL